MALNITIYVSRLEEGLRNTPSNALHFEFTTAFSAAARQGRAAKFKTWSSAQAKLAQKSLKLLQTQDVPALLSIAKDEGLPTIEKR